MPGAGRLHAEVSHPVPVVPLHPVLELMVMGGPPLSCTVPVPRKVSLTVASAPTVASSHPDSPAALFPTQTLSVLSDPAPPPRPSTRPVEDPASGTAVSSASPKLTRGGNVR